MSRVLVVHPSLQPPGGGNCVAAWALQALRGEHDVTMLAWRRPDLDPVNDYFGTSLAPGDFALRRVPAAMRAAVAALPGPSALLGICLTMRAARRLLARERFDAVLGTQNEMDFGRRGVQYIHFPTLFEPRPEHDLRWYHRPLALLAAYRRACRRIGGCTDAGVRANLTLVNSDWTGEHYRRRYGGGCVTLHPPVPGEFPDVPWAEREDGFVAIGRISPEKRLEEVIAILAALRARGRDLTLHLVGSADHRGYTRRILALAARERAWVRVHLDLPRAGLLELIGRQRYGIHGMVGEHFGIAVAELQRAGCIVFVADRGGQVEIVGGDPRQTFGERDDAVAKIDRVLGDPALRGELRRAAAARRDLFTAERFMEGIRAAVAAVAAGEPMPAPLDGHRRGATGGEPPAGGGGGAADTRRTDGTRSAAGGGR